MVTPGFSWLPGSIIERVLGPCLASESVYGCIIEVPALPTAFVYDNCCFCAIVTLIDELFSDCIDLSVFLRGSCFRLAWLIAPVPGRGWPCPRGYGVRLRRSSTSSDMKSSSLSALSRLALATSTSFFSSAETMQSPSLLSSAGAAT